MKHKNSYLTYIALIVICIVSSVSVARAASIQVITTDLPVDVKTRMQAEIDSSNDGSVRGGGDGRMYKGDTVGVKGESRGEARGMGTSTRSGVAVRIIADKDLSKVESDDDSVNVSYKIPAKLFGFIPVGMVVRTTVGSAGEVKVTHPWYSFLTASDDTEIQADFMSKIDAIKTEFGITTGAELGTSTKSDFIKAIHSILKEALDARTSAQADASVSN